MVIHYDKGIIYSPFWGENIIWGKKYDEKKKRRVKRGGKGEKREKSIS